MTRRTRKTLLIVLSVLVLLALAIFLRSKAPPEAARLLPESDGILYANLRPIRAFIHNNGELAPAPPRDPEYQQFIAATNIDWERDLDEAAIAIHKMPNPNGPNGRVAYSMVLVGTLNGKTLAAYLESHGAQKESYAGHTIYSLPSEGRTVRIVQIGYDMVAISNTPSTEQIHSIIDRHRSAALPFSGSTLLSHHYSEVPLLSLAWGVGQIGLPFADSGQAAGAQSVSGQSSGAQSETGNIHILGLELPIPADTTLVASARWAGSIHLRVDADTPDPTTALNQAAQISSLITLARMVTPQLAQDPTPAGQSNTALLQILSTAEITTHKDKLTATATIDPSKLK